MRVELGKATSFLKCLDVSSVLSIQRTVASIGAVADIDIYSHHLRGYLLPPTSNGFAQGTSCRLFLLSRPQMNVKPVEISNVTKPQKSKHPHDCSFWRLTRKNATSGTSDNV